MATPKRLGDTLLADAREHPRAPGETSPLSEPGWRHIDKTNLEDFTAEDWGEMRGGAQPK